MGTLCVAGPLATSLRGLWVSGLLPPDNGGRTKGRRPWNRPGEKGDDSGPRAGNPKRQRPNCHSRPRGTLEPAWVLHQVEGPQRPQCVKGKGPKDPGVAAPPAPAGCRGNRLLNASCVALLDRPIKDMVCYSYLTMPLLFSSGPRSRHGTWSMS